MNVEGTGFAAADLAMGEVATLLATEGMFMIPGR